MIMPPFPIVIIAALFVLLAVLILIVHYWRKTKPQARKEFLLKLFALIGIVIWFFDIKFGWKVAIEWLCIVAIISIMFSLWKDDGGINYENYNQENDEKRMRHSS